MKRVKASELPPPDPSILEDMLMSRRAPVMRGSEKSFLEGRTGANHDLDKMPTATRNRWIELAKKQGTTLDGKVHMSGIGEGLDSWVSSYDEFVDKVKAQGGKSIFRNGECIYAAEPTPPKPEVKLNSRIVEREVNRLLTNQPELKKVARQELRERVIDKHAPKRGKE